MTVAERAGDAVAALVRTGFSREDAQRDVAVLVRHLLGWDTAAWITRQRDEAPVSLAEGLDPLVGRRARGEPVAYLVGTKEFWGRAFSVGPAVLVPRPETEGLVERILTWTRKRPPGAPAPRILDVGTGSGCIAITLAAETADVLVVATDTSASALQVARSNAVRHGVSDRVLFVRGSLTAGTTGLDVVVSNPPYIAERDRDGLMRDVRDFEPATALFGGPDGLGVVRPLIADAAGALRPAGLLAVEIGAGQARDVAGLFDRAGFVGVTITPDLNGVPRIVEGTRPGPFV